MMKLQGNEQWRHSFERTFEMGLSLTAVKISLSGAWTEQEGFYDTHL